MHPFTLQSIAAERAKDLLMAAQRNRDAFPARELAVHQRRRSRTAGIARRLGFPLIGEDAGPGRASLAVPRTRRAVALLRRLQR